MQNMTTVQARIAEGLKQQAEQGFRSVGLTPSDAIRVFFKQSVNEGGILFASCSKIPNAETQAAMRDAKEAKVERFASVDAWFDSWKSD